MPNTFFSEDAMIRTEHNSHYSIQLYIFQVSLII